MIDEVVRTMPLAEPLYTNRLFKLKVTQTIHRRRLGTCQWSPHLHTCSSFTRSKHFSMSSKNVAIDWACGSSRSLLSGKPSSTTACIQTAVSAERPSIAMNMHGPVLFGPSCVGGGGAKSACTMEQGDNNIDVVEGLAWPGRVPIELESQSGPAQHWHQQTSALHALILHGGTFATEAQAVCMSIRGAG